MVSPAIGPNTGNIRLNKEITRRSDWQVRGAVGIVLFLVIVCFVAPFFLGIDPTAQSKDRFASVSLVHLFGTDELGRDLFSRVLAGGQLTFYITAMSTVLATVLGTLWGMLAAFNRGFIDEILMRLADTAMAIPQILFGLVFVSAFGVTPERLALIIGILLTPTTARLVRSTVLSEIQEDYFAAAIAYGATPLRLLFSEVIPNIRIPILVQAAINAANVILLEASMSFIGLGIQAPDATWGTLVQQGYQKIYQSLTYLLFPALMIFISIWLLNFIADQVSADTKTKGQS